MQVVCFPGVERNHQRQTPTREIRRTTKILWFLGSPPTVLARTGGKTKWTEAQVEVVEVDFRGWDQRGASSHGWMHMELEGNLGVMVDRVVAMTLSLVLEAWARAVRVVVGTRAAAVDVTGGMEAAGTVAPGGMTIVTATAITTGEMTTVEGGEVIIEVVGVVTVNVGEVVAAAEALAGDTELSLACAFFASGSSNQWGVVLYS